MEKEDKNIMCHISCFMFHVSRVTCVVSCVRRHMSHVTKAKSHNTGPPSANSTTIHIRLVRKDQIKQNQQFIFRELLAFF